MIIMQIKTKLYDMEILRAFAIVLIVVFHSQEYLHVFFNNINQWDDMAHIGLSLFFFISGFLLYYNYKNINFKNDLKTFYYRRAIRIYPLYWFALFIAFILLIIAYGFISIPPHDHAAILKFSSIISGILGLQALTEGNIGLNLSPFWFVGVILIYYLLYPFFTKPKNLINMFSLSLAFLLFLYVLNFKLNINYNLFYYYWMFFAGIAICWINDNNGILQNIKNFNYLDYRKLGELFLPLFLLVLLIQTSLNNYLTDIIELLLTTLTLYLIMRLIVSYIMKNYSNFFKSLSYNIISKISYGSYAIFLLHVSVFDIITFILIKLHLSGLQNLIVLIGIPISFIVGFYVQLAENKLMKWIKINKFTQMQEN